MNTHSLILSERLSRRTFLMMLFQAPLLVGCSSLLKLPLGRLSLDRKIGQMLLVGFQGPVVSRTLARDIRDHHIGGVVLFDAPGRNIVAPDQVRRLCKDLQRTSEIPLLIAIDQEGGMISRLNPRAGFPPTASAQYLGLRDDPGLTYRYASQSAQIMAWLGLNMNLAPVVDCNRNALNPVIAAKERSFSADPAVVTRYGLAFIAAHHDAGVLCSLKHFPGHGSSIHDSHHGLTDITATWSPSELIPFADIIKQGKADAVMTAHVHNTSLDPDHPATLSKPIIDGILRAELGYGGVVISDDMQMKAITEHYGYLSALELSINAGVDIILLANGSASDAQDVPGTIAAIEELVHQGRIPQARINEAYRRIMLLKGRIGAMTGRPVNGNRQEPNIPERLMAINGLG